MSAVQFDTLLAVLEPHINDESSRFFKPVDPEQSLGVCLQIRGLSFGRNCRQKPNRFGVQRPSNGLWIIVSIEELVVEVGLQLTIILVVDLSIDYFFG